MDAGASLQTLGPLAVNMWARIQTEHVELPLGTLRSRMQCLLNQLREDEILGLDILLPPDITSLTNWGGRKGPWRRLQQRVSSHAMAALIAQAEVETTYDVIARVISGAHSLAAAQLLHPEVSNPGKKPLWRFSRKCFFAQWHQRGAGAAFFFLL